MQYFLEKLDPTLKTTRLTTFDMNGAGKIIKTPVYITIQFNCHKKLVSRITTKLNQCFSVTQSRPFCRILVLMCITCS